MRKRLSAFNIPDVSINQIEERFFLILFEMFQVFKTLQCFFIKSFKSAIALQIIQRNFKGIRIFLAASVESAASPPSHLPIITRGMFTGMVLKFAWKGWLPVCVELGTQITMMAVVK